MSHLLLVDGSNLLHRAYHVAPNLATSTGIPVGGVHGFAWMLFGLVHKTPRTRTYTHAVVAFDMARANWRHAIDPGYKGSRFAKNERLTKQFDLAYECVEAFGMASVSAHGYEADDIIATYVEQFGEALHADPSSMVTIVSSDKDLTQLVSERTIMLDTMLKKTYDVAEVVARWGVQPHEIPMLLAIAGDVSDNIIGIERVGPKTAAKWLEKYGSYTALLENLSPVDQKTVKHNLRLTSLKRDVPSIPTLADVGKRHVDVDRLITFLDRYEFEKLTRHVLEAWGLPARAA